MEVTELPMVNVPFKLEQNSNAESPIVVTELGIVRDPMKLVLEKALAPIEVTEFPMVNAPLVKVHKRNASGSIEVTESGITRDPIKEAQL